MCTVYEILLTYVYIYVMLCTRVYIGCTRKCMKKYTLSRWNWKGCIGRAVLLSVGMVIQLHDVLVCLCLFACAFHFPLHLWVSFPSNMFISSRLRFGVQFGQAIISLCVCKRQACWSISLSNGFRSSLSQGFLSSQTLFVRLVLIATGHATIQGQVITVTTMCVCVYMCSIHAEWLSRQLETISLSICESPFLQVCLFPPV